MAPSDSLSSKHGTRHQNHHLMCLSSNFKSNMSFCMMVANVMRLRMLHVQTTQDTDLYFEIARFRDRSLIATFCPLCRKPVDTVDWQVAKKIGSLSFYTIMSQRWLISSLMLKGLYRWDFLIINIELKRKDGIFMYSRSLEDCNAEFFVS